MKRLKMKRSVERKRVKQEWMICERRQRHCLGQHHAVPLHPSGAGGRDRPQDSPKVRWQVRPGASRRSSEDQQEMGSRTRLDKATQRVTQVHPQDTHSTGPRLTVSERVHGRWSGAQPHRCHVPDTARVPGAELKCSSWVLREEVCEWRSW